MFGGAGFGPVGECRLPRIDGAVHGAVLIPGEQEPFARAVGVSVEVEVFAVGIAIGEDGPHGHEVDEIGQVQTGEQVGFPILGGAGIQSGDEFLQVPHAFLGTGLFFDAVESIAERRGVGVVASGQGCFAEALDKLVHGSVGVESPAFEVIFVHLLDEHGHALKRTVAIHGYIECLAGRMAAGAQHFVAAGHAVIIGIRAAAVHVDFADAAEGFIHEDAIAGIKIEFL